MWSVSWCQRAFSCINYSWIPIKAHYFFLYGALAGVLPFLPMIGRDLGLSATGIGIMYTLLPLSTFLSKPLFGYLADYLQKIRILVICLTLVTMSSLICILFLKPVIYKRTQLVPINAQCHNRSQKHIILPFEFNELCLKHSLERIKLTNKTAYIRGYSRSKNENNTENNMVYFDVELNCFADSFYSGHLFEPYLANYNISNCIIHPRRNSYHKATCQELQSSDTLYLPCEDSEVEANSSNPQVYYSYQFWIFTLLVVIAGATYTTATSLTDVACYEILKQEKGLYGRQRLWGTVSTGLFTFLTGYLNDATSDYVGHTSYAVGFFSLLVLCLIDVAILVNIYFPKTNYSENIFADTLTLFKKPQFIIYGTAVFMIGNFHGLLANYLFWYLKDLGANQTLLGAVTAVQCLVGEIPFFFFAGWFIKYLGYFNCLTCSFLAFTLRFGLYSILENPWLTLPIEVLHGVTYAVFYASKTAFASVNASPGTEGITLGILGGLCDGLGLASGSILSGLGFDSIGGRQTFLMACLLSLICAPLVFISHFIFKEYPTKDHEKKSTIGTIT